MFIIFCIIVFLIQGLLVHPEGVNTIAAKGIVYKYMGHRTRQLTILHNGASAHTLDDPPGLFDESGIWTTIPFPAALVCG